MRILLLILTAFIGIGAVYGGIVLISTNGGAWHLPVEWLGGHFSSYRIPGYILLSTLAVPNLAAFVLLLLKKKSAKMFSFMCGALIAGWIIIQYIIIGYRMWLQPAVLVIGLGIITASVFYKNNTLKK